jgi:hypothetical protein
LKKLADDRAEGEADPDVEGEVDEVGNQPSGVLSCE